MYSPFFMTTQVFGQQVITSVKKTNLFTDKSAGSRLERLKLNAALKFQQSQPKTGIIVKKDDNHSRVNAITRVRAGGYMVHHPHKSHIHLF